MTSTADSLAQPEVVAPERGEDPLAPILSLGKRELRLGLICGLLGSLFLHGVVSVQAAATLGDVHAFAVLVRAEVRDRLSAQVDIDLSEPPPPPPDAPPPPANAPAPPPPAAAEVGKVLTAEADPNEPVDMTNSIVTGAGERYAGGPPP